MKDRGTYSTDFVPDSLQMTRSQLSDLDRVHIFKSRPSTHPPAMLSPCTHTQTSQTIGVMLTQVPPLTLGSVWLLHLFPLHQQAMPPIPTNHEEDEGARIEDGRTHRAETGQEDEGVSTQETTCTMPRRLLDQRSGLV
jgi:hypothetical protein